MDRHDAIVVKGASEHNLKNVDVEIGHRQITVITGTSGSGKSSLAFDTILREAQRRFFYTLSNYTRQFLDMGTRPQVRHVAGLSPAIALAQSETSPSTRATVASLTDMGELFGVLFARFGERLCPKHGLATEVMSEQRLAEHCSARFRGETVAVCIPVARNKKGAFRAKLEGFAKKGYLRAFIDDRLELLTPVPQLEQERKHTIKIVVDFVKIEDSSSKRFRRSLRAAMQDGKQLVECVVVTDKGEPVADRVMTLSTKGGCPECGFSWPELDSRYFNANSLGRCEECEGFGVVCADDRRLWDEDCPKCEGTGLTDQYSVITFAGKSIRDVHRTPLDRLRVWLKQAEGTYSNPNPALSRVFSELNVQLAKVDQVDLGYLHLARRLRSLSGGEHQRLRLSALLSQTLRGVIYILDEPSQGLHPTQVGSVYETLVKIRDLGNTVILVDHDEFFIRHADRIIDLGPGGGAQGGQVIATFAPADASRFAGDSATANHLAQLTSSGFDVTSPRKDVEFLHLSQVSFRNLVIDKVSFQKSAINVVSGVSGAGKTSLAVDVLYSGMCNYLESSTRAGSSKYGGIVGHESFTGASLIDRRPIAKTSASMPATYLDIFTELRTVYSKVMEAQVMGFSARSFSLHLDGGRCPECKGKGEIVWSMRFLSDARVKCQLCDGRRYKDSILQIRYKDLSMSDVMDLTIEEAAAHFSTNRKIAQRLAPALDLGLGYLRLGQPTTSLSGGESQRLKLAPMVSEGRRRAQGFLVVLDEPTRGLHFADIDRLLVQLRELANLGATVVMVEHSLEMIRGADWIIDLGPGSAENGGKLQYQGLPASMPPKLGSPTARALFAH